MADMVTSEDLATFLRRDFDEFDAATADLLLDGAESAVREVCGWHIAPSRSETLTVDGSGSTLLELPTLHLTALTSVTEVGTAVDLSGVYWSTSGVLERGSPWTSRRRGVVVVATHGYTDPPGWLVTLICSVAGRALNGSPGIAAEAAGGESVTYDRSAPAGALVLAATERRLLDRLAVPGRP